MTQIATNPPAPVHVPPVISWDRATEDYLDWLENQRRTRRRGGRRAVGWIGVGVAVTTALAAVIVRFAGL